MKALDAFAGPGGWDVGAATLGVYPLGIEYDEAACETRDAAGHQTLRGDIAALDPLDFAPVELFIASPPCQAWSAAGKRGAQKDIAQVYALTDEIAKGYGAPCEWDPPFDWEDPRSQLIVEPLRWALALRPRYIALEQVPPVLGYWKHIAEILRAEGYGVWTGILEAERYGVPQTRERAILMAELGGNPHPPAPTHQRYVPNTPQLDQPMIDLLEGEIKPWVSMAEALGWGMTARPYPVVACSRDTGGPDMEKVGGSGAREQLYREQREGRWTVNTGRDWKEGGTREDAQTFDPEAQPAPAIDGKGRWHVSLIATNDRPNAAERDQDEPAPTMAFGHEAPRWKLRAGTNDHDVTRDAEEPAPTMRFGERLNTVAWTENRPAPTIVGTRRSDQGGIVGRALPEGEGRNVGGRGWGEEQRSGGELNQDDPDNSQMVGRPEGAIRVTEEEAGVLQGFPPDYPWSGNKTKRFQQIGNAIPPPLARAVLRALLP